MKYLLFFLLLPLQSLAQNYWTYCYSAPSYYYAKGSTEKLVKGPIYLCFNEGACYFKAGDNEVFFYLHDYQKRVFDGKLTEDLYSAATDADFEGDYLITIIHGKTIDISINFTRLGGYAYLFSTKNQYPYKEKIASKKIPNRVIKPTFDSLNTSLRDCPASPGYDISRYVSSQIHWQPDDYNSIEIGQVAASFTVDKDGYITDVKQISKALPLDRYDTPFADTVLNIFSSAPAWKPAKDAKKLPRPCSCKMTIFLSPLKEQQP